MKLSFECPACQRKMNVIKLMIAITPFIFTCIRCRSTIKPKGVFWLITLIMITAGSLMLFLIGSDIIEVNSISTKTVILSLIIYFVAELISAIIICNKAKITLSKNRYKAKE